MLIHVRTAIYALAVATVLQTVGSALSDMTARWDPFRIICLLCQEN